MLLKGITMGTLCAQQLPFLQFYTDNPLYIYTRYDKIRYSVNLTVMKPPLKREQLVTN